MSDPYLSDKLRGVLKMVVWSRKDRAKKDKLFAAAMKHINDAGTIDDKDVVRVLDSYAREFGQVGLLDESNTLSSLSSSIRQSLPNLYSHEGTEFDWWEQPSYIRTLPELPWEIEASRVQPGIGGGLGGFLAVCFLVFMVIGIPYSLVVQPLLKSWKIDDAIPALLFLAFLPVGAFGLYALRDARLARKSRGSWCRLTEEGIEFHEPGNAGKILWSEVKDVRSDIDPTPDEDSSYEVAEVSGINRKKIRISSQFYTDQEVKMAFALCMLKKRSTR